MKDETRLRDLVDKTRGGADPQAFQQALTDLANFYRGTESWDQLEAVIEERHAFEQARSGGPGMGLVYLASNFADAGLTDRAVALIERAEDEFRRAGYDDVGHQWQALWSARIAVMLAAGRLDDAILSCRKTVDIARAAGAEYSDYWEMHGYLADLLQFKKKDVPEAVKEREMLWSYFRKRLSRFTGAEELSYNAISVHVQNGARLAHGYRALRREAEGIRIFEALVVDVEKSTFLGVSAVELPTLLVDLSELHAAVGNSASAKKCAADALARLDRHGHQEPELRARATVAKG